MLISRALALAFTLLGLTSAVSRAAECAAPADPQLNAKGRAILAYYQQLQSRPELKLISGQFLNFGPGSSLHAAERIFATTGQWPAMIAADYTDFKTNWLDTATPNKIMIDYWRTGGLVSMGVHLNCPARAEGGGQRDKGIKIADVLAPGTPMHEHWLRQLDTLAAGLQELQAAGVVVLWRPMHEMNGGWFWWGAQEPKDFVVVWRQMFDYFTQSKGLHNLIWVYSPNHMDNAANFYPGDAYADLVGIDAYTDDIDPKHIQGYPTVSALNKPFGFTEFGPHGPEHPPGDYDYRRFLTGLETNFSRSRFFLSWDDKWNPAENQFAHEFYNDPRVITRDRLPVGLAGKIGPLDTGVAMQ